jgi:TatD DNase family protein
MKRCIDSGLAAVVCNGLEPASNRRILQLASIYPVLLPALGIYPIHAIHKLLDKAYGGDPIEPFDVDAEIAFIAEQARSGSIVAVGECGLDGYWAEEDTFAEQERVFESLVQVSIDANIPVIVHSRKREKRTLEILAHLKAPKVVMHCYCGKVKWAIDYAERLGVCFSIPANAPKNGNFIKMLKELPRECVLTETDAPYLAPVRGERNEPANVVATVGFWAELLEIPEETAKKMVYANFERLFRG